MQSGRSEAGSIEKMPRGVMRDEVATDAAAENHAVTSVCAFPELITSPLARFGQALLFTRTFTLVHDRFSLNLQTAPWCFACVHVAETHEQPLQCTPQAFLFTSCAEGSLLQRAAAEKRPDA